MVLALTANIILSAIVFATIITLLVRGIRRPVNTAVATVAPRPRAERARSREHRSGGLVTARPWA